MSRGYFGIGCINMKNRLNYGTLFRSASCFGASFIFLIGKRFEMQASDTQRSERHIPLYRYENYDEFLGNIPFACRLVSAEMTDNAHNLINFVHPERAIYLLGPEDGTIPLEILDKSLVVKIPTSYCLNLAVAGSILLYDRISKDRV